MAWRGSPHDDDDFDDLPSPLLPAWTAPEQVAMRVQNVREQYFARKREERAAQWEAHFEARRELIAQVQWQSAPPDLDPTAREGARVRRDGVTRYNFQDYVMDYANQLEHPGSRTDPVWFPGPGRVSTTTSKRIEVATIDDDAEFAATRSANPGRARDPAWWATARPHAPNRTPVEDHPYWHRRASRRERHHGDEARVRSEVGPRLASYMHAKTAKVVDSTAFVYKTAMQSPGFASSDGFPGYMKDLPSDLLPFYEMELRCDPRRMEPTAWRVDITAKREPEQTIETSALCVCRPVTRFRTFRGDDNDEGLFAVGIDTTSFPDYGIAPAYVILTALRQRVLDSNGAEVAQTRRVVDDYVVVDKNYQPIEDLLDGQAAIFNGPDVDTSFFQPYPAYWHPWDRAVVLNASPLMLEGDCFRSWRQLSRAVRSVGPALEDARMRAAERVYAPGAAGAEDARANFERLAREQVREARRRRHREARQEEERTSAPGTLPSLAALRL